MSDRKLLFIHGAGVEVDDPQGMPVFLKRALADRFAVVALQMPEAGAADWIAELLPLLKALPADAVLVGHSLGGSTLLKAIAEHCPGLNAAGLVLLAPPFWGAPDWDYSEFAPPEGFAAALGEIGTVVHLQGRRDEIVDFSHQAMYAAQMPEADYRALDCGHGFDGAGQTAVLEAIGSI